MNVAQINAIGLAINSKLAEKEKLQKEITEREEKIGRIISDIAELSEGVQEARAKL